MITFFRLVAILLLACSVQHVSADVKKKKTTTRKNPNRKHQRPTLNEPIYYLRNGAHYSVDKAQAKIDKYDGLEDSLISYFGDEELTEEFSAIIIDSIDDRQIIIENEKTNSQEKIRDLYNLERITGLYYDQITQKYVNQHNYRELFDSYSEIMENTRNGKISKYIADHHNRSMMDLLFLLDEKDPEVTNLVVWYCNTYPNQAINMVSDSWDKVYVDTMVSILAPDYGTKFLAYAQATGPSRRVMSRNKTKTVQTLYNIATQSTPKNVYKNYVFYDAIAADKMTIAEADRISNDKAHAFENMVKYRLDNAQLTNTKEILADIKIVALQKYIRKINELHDASAAVRFKVLEPLSAEELYYVAISGADEIYTSSFLGLYERMMARWKEQSTAELLDKVHYDKFRTFIRMASGYNVIGDFLAHMSESEQKKLIKDFVSDLEKNIKTNGLADAVDVADSYGSIKDTVVQDYIRELVKEEYQRTRKAQNTKGMAIYSILLNVFDGKNKLNNGENVLELPPVLDMPIEQLRDENGKITAVMFFYGDEDGRGSFNTYRNRLSGNFSIKSKKDWIEATSKQNPNFTIYINQPHPEPEDETAQRNMMNYLHANGLHPSVLVHRGHSYHVSLSIDQIEPSNRVVILGSCGGYHNLKSILERSVDAQIVSSKQTGVGVVNNRILDGIFGTLADEKDIDWIPLWDDIRGVLKSSPQYLTYFEDYIPPYQNLGAIFVLSYYKLVGNFENSSEG